MAGSGNRKPRARPGQGGAAGRRVATSPAQTPGARSEDFRERLGSIETLLEEALRESGGADGPEGRLDPVTRVAEGALDLYARLGRTLENGTVAEALAQFGVLEPGDPQDFGYDGEFEQALLPLLRFLYESWWRVDVAGLEHLPEAGRVVLVANASGSLFPYEGVMVRRALAEHGRSARPLVDSSLFEVPVLGELLARLGVVRASRENAAGLLERAQDPLFLPEGRAALGKAFAQRHEVGDFVDETFVEVASAADVWVLPVAVVGAAEAHPVLGRFDWLARRVGLPFLPVTPTFPWLGVGGLLPLPSRWRIEFGRPLDVCADGLMGTGMSGGVGAAVRAELQTLLAAALARRGGVFGGS